MSNATIWTGMVVEDGEDYALTLPIEMMAELNWHIGDVLVWNIDEENRITLTKQANDT